MHTKEVKQRKKNYRRFRKALKKQVEVMNEESLSNYIVEITKYFDKDFRR